LAAPPKSPADRAEYQQAIGSALAEFDAGNFPEARGLFTRAHQLYPNARTYRGLGFVAFELRNYGECVEQLEQALGAGEKPLSEALRRSTEELLKRARAMTALVHMNVSPRTESWLVDGVPVEPGPERTLVLQVGDHVVEVRAAGYLPERRALKIAGGEELHLAIEMRAAPAPEPAAGPRIAAAAPEPAPREDEQSRKRWYKSPWLWTGVAVALAGAAVGTYFAVRPESETHVQDPAVTANTPEGGVVQAWRAW
jgi:tetratricopeptide (TPR) repeat protein